MKKYAHIFFDLDNTLWDFERNSRETLNELYHKHRLADLGVSSPEFFILTYQERNTMMWEQYRLGKIDKETLRNKRFAFTFWDMGLEAELAPMELAEDYIRLSPKKNYLFPHAHETLSYLQTKYSLHIITNGFQEAQYIKLDSAGLSKYFSEIIISEHTGFKKPDAQIFHHSAQKANAVKEECLMIGDGLEVDVAGARNAGWDTVFFNPNKITHDENTTYEISSLDQLTKIL
jgi:putative hydrolase of the HAD superfamily